MDGETKVPTWLNWIVGTTIAAGIAFLLWTAVAWWLKRHALLESKDAPSPKKARDDEAQ
ncbi:MAG: hypothetical protein M0Z95_18510 [Actinomycetota bacterium]|jgi:threonine/homoserine/homoserine lactone efflux protein|nr:hypothetical protein [Actinomycetota bacterium]